MLRYLFAWAPAVVVVGTVVILSCAYLALIVFMLVAFVALPVLVGAIVVSPFLLARYLYRSGRSRAMRLMGARRVPAELNKRGTP